ncbi:MAG: ABC transporter permease [Solirubrobacteraceae bacterium]
MVEAAATTPRPVRAAAASGAAARLFHHRWLRFAMRRLLTLIAMLAALLIVTFAIVQLIPGEPARLILGSKASASSVAALRVRLGLNRSFGHQLLHYVAGAVHLHFGSSFVTGQSVTAVLLERLPYTLELAGVALVAMMGVGVGVGVLAATITRDRRHPRLEVAFMFVTGLAGGVPSYLAATFLAFLFAVTLRWLPVSGASGPASVVLPVLAVALPPAGLLARIVRVQTLDVFAQDYMRSARSKRLRAARVYALYVLPNVLNAALTVGGLLFLGLIGGTVVVENVFAWPGLGTLVVQSITRLDYPVIQGATLLLGVVVVVINTFVDVMRGVLDPQSAVDGR